MSCSFPSPDFFLFSSFWFQNLRLFRCFQSQLNPSFLLLNVYSGSHLVVHSLYLQSWRRLLIVDFGDSRVFMTYPDVVKEVFIPKQRILPSSTLVLFGGLPGLLMMISPVHYLRMYQTIPLATPKAFLISLAVLFTFWTSVTCINIFLDSSSQTAVTWRIQHLKSTADL